MVVAELACDGPVDDATDPLPRLSTDQIDLLRGDAAQPDLRWQPHPDLLEQIWPGRVHELPLTVCRWLVRADAGGSNRVVGTELRATARPDEASVLLMILAAHLRLLGVDPELTDPWLEERLGPP